jgi:threonylcarbamoyladenosine tRNA methylthiotransferase MtaB
MFSSAGAAVALRSIGCRTNQEEIFALKGALQERGFRVVDSFDNAQIVIINTCSVTSLTESKTARFLRAVNSKHPGARILVTGCFAQQHGEALLKYPGVEWVAGNAHKRSIPDLLSGKTRNNCTHEDEKSLFWEDCLLDPAESGRTRFSLKIQEGCNFKCSYCIVPALRGPSRSAPRQRMLDVFKRAVDMGYKEIVLTGTHIGQYRDHNNNSGLEELITQFLKVDGDYRIRLSSLDPRDLTDTLIAMAGEENRVCGHLHVSVQSLCGDVLSLMNRPHAQLETLIDRLRSFRQKYPDAALGGDFIVGHPGESGAMFETTLHNVKQAGFTYGHVFRYSKRPGTASAEREGQIAESVKKTRGGLLRDLLRKSRDVFLYSQFSRPLCIIIEESEPVRGISGNYIKVEVPKISARKNGWMRVGISGKMRGVYCVAECLNGD